MGRIVKAYEATFRALLQRVNAHRLDKGVCWLMEKAQRMRRAQEISIEEALRKVHERLASQLPPREEVARSRIRFFCDAGLGGLARWLRGAGYEAFWRADIDDDALVREAHAQSAVILTTDSLLMERRLLRDRIVLGLWLPPTLKIPEQLSLVFREFKLTLRPARCMTCGGELQRREKESLRERIPPKTYLWLDEYFVCAQCGKLFWHGTHWEKIRNDLKQVAGR